MQDGNTLFSENRNVFCNGAGNNQGHPGVYLFIAEDKVFCPYCNRKFVYHGPVVEGRVVSSLDKNGDEGGDDR